MKKLKKFICSTLVATLIATSFSFAGIASAATVPTESEPNDTAANADTIVLNSEIKGSVEDYDDEKDYYKFTLAESGVVDISFLHKENEMDSVELYVYDAGLNNVLDKINVENKIEDSNNSLGLDKGTYYILVKNLWNTGDYSIKLNFTPKSNWETELNDNVADAEAISTNKTYYGSATGVYRIDTDYYKFTLPKDGKINISLIHDYLDSYIEWDVELLNSNYNTVDEYSISADEGTLNTSNLGLAAGTYYIKIDSEEAEYNFRVNYTASSYWEKELNNNYKTATPISMNTSYNGNVSNYNPIDFYKFTKSKAGYASIYTNAPSGIGGISLAVYDSNMNELTSQEYPWYNYEGVASMRLDTPYLKLGTYYVKYDHGYSSGIRDYTISVRDVKPVGSTKINAYGYGVGANKITWNKATNATGYKIYRATSKNGKYTYIKATKSKYYIDKKVKKGKTYYYKVKPYRSLTSANVNGPISSANAAKVNSKVNKASLTLKKYGKKQVKVTIKSTKGATGYKIYRSTSKNGKYKCIKTTTAKTYIDKKVKKGKRYYYKVKAYSNSNKTYYGKLSAVKSIKR